PAFTASEHRLALVLGAHAASDFQGEPVPADHAASLGPPRPGAGSPLPVLLPRNCKAWLTASCLQHGSLNILSPPLRPSAPKIKIPFKILLLSDNAPSHARALMETCAEIYVVFMPVNTPSVL
ncbi:TIGD1 protein, partial [Crocuta crocuta]